MNAELQTDIVAYLESHGVTAKAVGDTVAVNRTSMCNSVFSFPGVPEVHTYLGALGALGDEFDSDIVTLYWCGKTDEDLFLDNLRQISPYPSV